MGGAGFLFMLLALIAGAGAAYFYLNGMRGDNTVYEKIGGYFLIAQGIAIGIASLILLLALATSNFKIEYVAQYTDLALPMAYKLTAFWAGQAGSLLFWALLLVLFAIIELIRLRDHDSKYKSSVLFVISITSSFFLILTCFVTNPFAELGFMPADGVGLNPLLQNPGMIYHPPTLFIGYAGFTVPLGHAIASIITQDGSSKWVKESRGWNIIVWVFLTIGIVLGGQWAYVELGWGGYWAWDPVENASFLPWITGTALLHSAIVYEQRNKLKIWTHVLLFVSFLLCIFGTFLTRSGVIESVHSFGKSSLGSFFIVFMIVSTIAYLIMLLPNLKIYKDKDDEKEFSFSSREGLFFIANWLFVGLTVVVFVGTTMPILSQGFYAVMGIFGVVGNKLTVGIPYFNQVSTPFFMLILLFAGLAPLAMYGREAGKDFFKKLLPGIVASVVVMAVMFFKGYTLLAPLLLAGVTTLSLTTIINKMATAIKNGGAKAPLNQRRLFGGLTVHIGVVIMAYGIIASSFYNYKDEYVVAPGESFNFLNYRMDVGELTIEKRPGANFTSVYAPVTVYDQTGKKIVTVGPERRFYDKRDEAWAEVAIYSKLSGDLYFILASYSKPENYIGIQVVHEPLLVWLWIGCVIMCIGGFYSISGGRRTNA